MPVSTQQQAVYEDLVEVVPGATQRKLFGCPACMVNGYMFFGVHRTGVFVRLSTELGAELAAEGGRPFEPMAGRTMGGFWTVPEDVAPDWVRRAFEHAKALPPKATGKPAPGGSRRGPARPTPSSGS
jgi:hypothetical protein